MNTYWLIARQHTTPEQRMVVLNDIAPDLISNVDIETGSPISIPPYSVPRPAKYPRNSFCNCETKCIYNRRSDDNVNNMQHRSGTGDSPLQRRNHAGRQTMDVTNYLCVCRLNNTQSSQLTARGPRSAPNITFRM